MKRSNFCSIGAIDGTGNGMGDDILGDLFRNSALRSIRRPAVSDVPPEASFGGSVPPTINTSPTQGSNQDPIDDFLADFDSWGTNPPKSKQVPAAATTAAQGTPVPPASNAQDAVPQGGQSRAESPSEALHPAVGDLSFTGVNRQVLMDHYTTSIPANLFEFTVAEQQQMASGDYSPMASKSAAFQKTIAQTMATVVSDALALVEQQMKPVLSKALNAYTDNSNRTSAISAATDGFDRGGIQFMAKAVAERYLQANPRATPDEVKQATQKYFNGLKSMFTAQGRPTNQDQSTDWLSFIGQ